ncbi:methionyl-tRNA synthetase [Coemansia brasiliensis]|uniref:Probable methionine--tRNA ligase, mitochondrial n=1 Tax=Coemansia brasiliensis TaxID=2650707 RepID=A0A9W8IHZ8_9FUNG|nr:methionyl-tRNA synthetase [Coemansia brasiliensis]
MLCRARLLSRTSRAFRGFATKTASHDQLYVTQPIFYVNAKPHIGHFYTVVLADTIKRFGELKGKETRLSAGTDEHGMKIQQAAMRARKDPLEFCTENSDQFRALMKAANASITDFTRTTSPGHREKVIYLWKRLVDNGLIYKGSHAGWYAVSDEAFYTSGQVEERQDSSGNRIMVAKESGQPVEWIEEENYMFRLSGFREKLIEWVSGDVIYPEARRNEVLAWLRAGLEDLSVSRPSKRQRWGIRVPDDPDHTIYVWVDALANYLRDDKFFPPDMQVVGKDILRFHAVYWPAMLLAAKLPLPRRILAHAHWTMGAQKMSKSRGNVVDPFAAIGHFGADAMRYYVIRNGGIADDRDFSLDEVLVRYRKDLGGQLGNLAARCLSPNMGVNLNCFAAIGEAQSRNADNSADVELRETLINLPAHISKLYEVGEFGRGMVHIFDALALANRYITQTEPWHLAKLPDAKDRLQTVLFYVLESVRLSALMLQPVMPQKSSTLLDHLAIAASERSWDDVQFGKGWPNTGAERRSLDGVAKLFPKIYSSDLI